MKVILIADALTLLVQYNILSDVESGIAAISISVIDATLRGGDGKRVTLSENDRNRVMCDLEPWIEKKVVEHSKGMFGFDAWYAEHGIAIDGGAQVAIEDALILARAAYGAGQLSVGEVSQ